jgi:predicted nucleotide-binding protein (sugar kinase/HSP70/actin superfamily)
MRVGFPHAGNVYIPIKTLLQELDVDFVVPPPTSNRTLSLGTKYSPEGACLPFKLTLGNLIEACELGADTLLQAQGFGVCRLGYYARTQEQILRDLGYDFEMVNFSVSEENKLLGFLKMFKRVANNAPWSKVIPAFRFGIAKLNTIDDIERVVQKVRPVEQVKGAANRLFKQALDRIDQVSDHASLKGVKRDYLERLNQIPKNPDANPLKIGVVGEIFVVLDPFSNMDLEVELGKLGVEVKRTISFSRWTRFSLFLNPLGVDEWKKVHQAAMPYLKRDVGGDGWESVGEKVLHAGEYDGIIHVAPFTCLPEVIAQNIMPSTREDIPVLTFLCDEQMGKAGMMTRLEAFVDLLERRRKQKVRRNSPIRN